MFKRILVPLDGTALADHAVTWAERLAARGDAELFLLQVVPPQTGQFAARPTPAFIAAQTKQEAREISTATTMLSNRAHALHGRGLRASRYVRTGWPSAVIADFAGEHGVDLVVMGTHGREGVPRALLGSVADEIRRETATPLLLVPSDATPPLGAPRVLIGLDGWAEAETALDAGLVLAAQLGASVDLLQVIDAAAPLEPALSYLEDASQAATAVGLHASTIVSHGDPGLNILISADMLEADAIALASHGRSGLARAALGSVASYVLSHAKRPVLLTRRAASRAPGDAVPEEVEASQ